MWVTGRVTAECGLFLKCCKYAVFCLLKEVTPLKEYYTYCVCVCQCVCGGGVGGSGVSSERLCASWCPRLSVLLTAAVYGNFNTKNTTKDVCRSAANDFSWHFFSRETKSCFRPLCYSLEIPTAGVCIRFTPLEIIVSSWDQTGISGTLHNNSNNRNKPMTDLKINPWWLLMSTKSLNKNH